MPVQFKFRGERAFRGLLNVTTPCTLYRVKNAIYEQARISDETTDLALEDPETGRPLDPAALLVQDALVQVIVCRTPKAAAIPVATVSLEPAGLASDDVLEAERQEEDMAIDRMIDNHDLAGIGIVPHANTGMLRYSRSYRLAVGTRRREREGYDVGSGDEGDNLKDEFREPPPANYTCHRCGMAGGKPESHWIWECPTNEDPDHMKKVRTAKGIPRDFLRKVATVEEGQELSAGGVTFTLPGHSGHYIVSHEATFEEKKQRVGDTVQEKVTTAFSDGARRVEDSLKCPLCHQMFRQAILAPCCGATFCSDCAIDRLAHSSVAESSACPGCGKEVLAHQLVANEDIRKQVEQISRATKAMAVATQKDREKPRGFAVDAALKDRVNRPRKHAASASTDEAAAATKGAAAAGSAREGGGSISTALLALTDGGEGAASGGAPGSACSAGTSPGPRVPASWQPLGFGPMLSPAQFKEWQRLVGSGPPSQQARGQFEAWQRRLREAAPPPPSKESFEEWQRVLQRKRAGTP
mmetsp:Transcript_15318/g.43816  ORF Transcript_15318/g.43816 Transcript_15318/m.43816 type:complete len:526 (+) Transcript_15318:96-1673(+)